jgi:hypothetical protein
VGSRNRVAWIRTFIGPVGMICAVFVTAGASGQMLRMYQEPSRALIQFTLAMEFGLTVAAHVAGMFALSTDQSSSCGLRVGAWGLAGAFLIFEAVGELWGQAWGGNPYLLLYPASPWLVDTAPYWGSVIGVAAGCLARLLPPANQGS